MDGKKKRQQNKKFWIAAKRLATSIGVSTNNATYIENDSDSNDSPDKCTNLIDTLGSGQGMFVEDEAPHSTETSEGGDETDDKTWNMIDEDPVVSSDSLSSDEERNTCITSDLVSWINKHQIKHNAADDLLKLLKEHGSNTLPLSARTLLKTDKNVLTKEKSGMSYIYLGLEKSLVRNFEKYPSETRKSTPKIEVSLNVDGLPLFKSSNTCMWPVLCAIMIHPVTVFPVALTFGKSKPCNLDFLNDTIRELNHILQHGILYEESTIRVSLKCTVCDAPARAMIKATKLYSGYYGCDRCTQRGAWYGRLTYQEIDNLVLRTNQTFRDQVQEGHHSGVSPFVALPVDLIKSFSIGYMHQSCLGVMRRLLLIWIKGKKETRLTARHVDDISKKLLQIQQFVPREFARKPRGLEVIDRWKATEFRQFLLYTGKLVLKGILRSDLYSHFMTLSVALCILVSPRLVQTHKDYAHLLLVYFVRRGRELYGKEFLVYNVHCMLHLAEDACWFGSLDACAAFPFENYLYRIKKMVRSGKNPLSQVVKRIHELENDPGKMNPSKFKGTIIYTNRPDNVFFLEDSSCCEVVALTHQRDDDGNQKILCRVYNRIESDFSEPCDSRIIGVYRINTTSSCMKFLTKGNLQTKAMMVDSRGRRRATALAILHEL
ncbi:hypothetical protein Pcinc_026365 [Petrolisthes cinctipes]|uniref:Transposase domain-containing protein n=1 Tax=Petrolisthes cinctipes TaxID=88211 RepID=A0AAE1K881_PETCI|nr:hypothetical protein Pcinc_026365 [Petrolisthes cinctipes]